MAKLNLTDYVDQFRNLNARDVSTWPIAPRIAAVAALVAVVMLLGYYFAWSDKFDELQRGQDEEVQLKNLYKDKLQQAVNLEPLRKQKELATRLGELSGKPKESKLHKHPISENTPELGGDVSVISSMGYCFSRTTWLCCSRTVVH